MIVQMVQRTVPDIPVVVRFSVVVVTPIVVRFLVGSVVLFGAEKI